MTLDTLRTELYDNDLDRSLYEGALKGLEGSHTLETLFDSEFVPKMLEVSAIGEKGYVFIMDTKTGESDRYDPMLRALRDAAARLFSEKGFEVDVFDDLQVDTDDATRLGLSVRW